MGAVFHSQLRGARSARKGRNPQGSSVEDDRHLKRTHDLLSEMKIGTDERTT